MIIKDRKKLQKLEGIYLRRQLIINDIAKLQEMLSVVNEELNAELKNVAGAKSNYMLARPHFEAYKLIALEIPEGGGGKDGPDEAQKRS